MKCPYCSINFHKRIDKSFCFETDINKRKDLESKSSFDIGEEFINVGGEIVLTYCPGCHKGILTVCEGTVSRHRNIEHDFYEEELHEKKEEKIIFPEYTDNIILPEYIPAIYTSNYKEAYLIRNLSPKASAAISRRCLQLILREEFNIKKNTLQEEINEFLKKKDIPSNVFNVVDAIRKIGNMAAHPTKYTSNGEIVEIEIGEAEWLLEIIFEIFDFRFIKPKLEEKRKNELEEKISKIEKAKKIAAIPQIVFIEDENTTKKKVENKV